MTGLEIWLLAIGLAMDCFAVSIASGIILKRTQWRPMLVMALAFGLFQALMPFIGWMFAKTFSHLIESVDHWIAFAILAFLGGRMILESFKDEDCRQTFNPASRIHNGDSDKYRCTGNRHLLCPARNQQLYRNPLSYPYHRIRIIRHVAHWPLLRYQMWLWMCTEIKGGIMGRHHSSRYRIIDRTSILTIISIGSSNKKNRKTYENKKEFPLAGLPHLGNDLDISQT
jgi:hypothetical protein